MSVTTFILTVIIADKISPVSLPGRWAGSLVAGFIGNWIGPLIFRDMGSYGSRLFVSIRAIVGA